MAASTLLRLPLNTWASEQPRNDMSSVPQACSSIAKASFRAADQMMSCRGLPAVKKRNVSMMSFCFADIGTTHSCANHLIESAPLVEPRSKEHPGFSS